MRARITQCTPPLPHTHTTSVHLCNKLPRSLDSIKLIVMILPPLSELLFVLTMFFTILFLSFFVTELTLPFTGALLVNNGCLYSVCVGVQY